MIKIEFSRVSREITTDEHGQALVFQHVRNKVGELPTDGMITIACEHVADDFLNKTHGEAYGNGWGKDGEKLWESFSGEFEASAIGDALIEIFFHGKV